VTSPDLLEAIIDSHTGHAVVCMDADGVIALWNSGAKEIFQYAADEVVGRHADVLLPPEDANPDALRAELVEVARSGRIESAQWLVRKDGTKFWAEGMTYPLRGKPGAESVTCG